LIRLKLVAVLVDVVVEADGLIREVLIGLGRITPLHGFRSLGQWRLPVEE
jgi:hypothetical protein